ncbi:hypothetical protein PMY56_02180 [Clostridium tertium]|uniref:hypothetical protein n=1 Tax=Clostridium tertium TaxID=1559 RepID=UPI0023314B02|nr:hypothetical protein [Clostridium tertium]MDB1921738.1 hypothetical protein [Clostridium tertium]MDB1924941.1 hypothetical protein [Clostridium tertium]MDB1929580.1 hypothetical protein [Clostridium tertium]
MKKSTLLAFSGLIIVFFIITSLGNRTNVYEKQIRYNTPEEAIVNFIGYINSYEEVKTKNGYYTITPNEFYESISKRYRLYLGEGNANMYIVDQVPVVHSYELEEVSLNDLRNLKMNYEDSFKGMMNYRSPSEVRVYKLDAVVSYNYAVDKNSVKEDGTVDKAEYMKETKVNDIEETQVEIYLVVVDEGEGYVVDYYNTIYK